jgi:lipid II:glycine glycyltransferase (peptidoglycan interpeptide bridge formation enzyme)
MSFYFRDEVLPYHAGDMPEARDLAANDFKYWELMRRACERGLRVFDYGRSKKDTGSHDFKKNWGFEPEPLHYEFHLLRGRGRGGRVEIRGSEVGHAHAIRLRART